MVVVLALCVALFAATFLIDKIKRRRHGLPLSSCVQKNGGNKDKHGKILFCCKKGKFLLVVLVKIVVLPTNCRHSLSLTAGSGDGNSMCVTKWPKGPGIHFPNLAQFPGKAGTRFGIINAA